MLRFVRIHARTYMVENYRPLHDTYHRRAQLTTQLVVCYYKRSLV